MPIEKIRVDNYVTRFQMGVNGIGQAGYRTVVVIKSSSSSSSISLSLVLRWGAYEPSVLVHHAEIVIQRDRGGVTKGIRRGNRRFVISLITTTTTRAGRRMVAVILLRPSFSSLLLGPCLEAYGQSVRSEFRGPR